MSLFFEALWESVFQPGTTPQLIVVTHISFACLLTALCIMLYMTHSIHFCVLSLISLALWATITWFIWELKHVKLQTNAEFETLNESKKKTTSNLSNTETKVASTKSACVNSLQATYNTRSRYA